MGKASKHRFCPATGGDLRPAECGAGRNSRYRCPAVCPHNPLGPGNYDQLLAVEDGLDAKTFRWVDQEDPGRDPSFASRINRARAGSEAHGFHAAVVWRIFFERDASGLTPAERWERAGLPGLNNDERVLFAAKMRMRIVHLEVRKILGEGLIEATDFLAGDGEPLRIMDRAFCARAVRFATLLGWAYPLPHFWRLSGTAITHSSLGPFSAEDVLDKTILHLGGPSDREARRLWLAENFVRMDKSITATANERMRRMYLALDASWGHAIYELRAPYENCRAVLDAEPTVEPTNLEAPERAEGFTEIRAWFDDTSAARSVALGMGRPLLGTVKMREGSWKVEASSSARLDHLRRLFEGRLGPRVQFVRERRDDLGARMAKDLPAAGDPGLVPPGLLEQVDAPAFSVSRVENSGLVDSSDLVSNLRRNALKRLPDEPVPALDGLTPREASRNPGMRKRLIALMKGHVRLLDEENLRKGSENDINPVLRELGLHEIDFPPPPRRPVPRSEGDMDDRDDDVELPFKDEPKGMPGPPLPPLPRSRPLTLKEAEYRFQASVDRFNLAADGLDTMKAAGCTLIGDLEHVTTGLIPEESFAFLVPILMPAWFALVPAEGQAPVIPQAVLRSAIKRFIETFASGEALSAPDRLLGDHRQPELARFALDICVAQFAEAPKKMKPRPEIRTVIMLVLVAVIDEIDRAVRS